jgi:hypothetical protein
MLYFELLIDFLCTFTLELFNYLLVHSTITEIIEECQKMRHHECLWDSHVFELYIEAY